MVNDKPKSARVPLVVMVEPAVRLALKRLALDRGVPMSVLVRVALAGLFADVGKGGAPDEA